MKVDCLKVDLESRRRQAVWYEDQQAQKRESRTVYALYLAGPSTRGDRGALLRRWQRPYLWTRS